MIREGQEADESRLPGLPDASAPSAERLQWVESRMAIEHEVVEQFIGRVDELQEEVEGAPQKVAFLFLTMKELQFPKLWQTFFKDADKDLYSIYLHRAVLKDEQRAGHEIPLAEFGAIDVPWVKTAWCALFGVEVASLFAAMKDPRNVQFVFISDSSVPLKPFSYVYHELVETSPGTSKICLASAASSKWAIAEFTKQESSAGEESGLDLFSDIQ